MISLASRGGKDRRILLGLLVFFMVSIILWIQLSGHELGRIKYIPRTRQNGIPHPDKLRNNTQYIQMRPIREQKVPQMKDLGKRRRACAECEDRRERV